jgi:hypothetical protein
LLLRYIQDAGSAGIFFVAFASMEALPHFRKRHQADETPIGQRIPPNFCVVL